MKIPKRFKLFATTINVVFDEKRMNNKGCLGLSEIMHSKISLTKKYHGKKLSKELISDTYYHEKVHIILDSMCEFKLSKNEKFVEVFSRLLRQSDDTAEFDISE